MMSKPERYDWLWFKDAMDLARAHNTKRIAPLLDLIGRFNALLNRLLDREVGIEDSSRPQDFVACMLAAKSFRLMIGGLSLAVQGYPDLAAILERTLWEIAIRLRQMKRDPVAGALGLRMYEVSRLIAAMETALECQKVDTPESRCLKSNLAAAHTAYEMLVAKCNASGLEPSGVHRRYGRIKFRDACRDQGIEMAYGVNYIYLCLLSHGQYLDHFTVRENGGERRFEPGPVPESCIETAMDLMNTFCSALKPAVEIVEDEPLISEVEALVQAKDNVLLRLRDGGETGTIS